jgi:hypothetical protein
MRGRVVVTERGQCDFYTKGRLAAAAGVAAVLVVNNADGAPVRALLYTRSLIDACGTCPCRAR